MPFCPQCGVDNPAGARYCDQCGAMLVPVPAPQPAAQSTAPVPVVPAPVASGAPLISASPVCPQCGTPAIPGEAFCDNCGAALSAPTVASASSQPMQVPPQTSFPAPQPSTSPPAGRLSPPVSTPPAPSAPYTPPATQAPSPGYGTRSVLAPGRLNIAATGQSIALPSAGQVVVGRADPVSQFYPDLDLTPYGALDHGVGRRHMRLFVNNGQVMIEDLESTNGTFVNGQRLAPRQPQILRNADQVMAGNLVMQYQE